MAFNHWNRTSTEACHEKNFEIRSFAMLLPCGISLFSGVEFVCCPLKNTSKFLIYLYFIMYVKETNLNISDLK